MTLGALEISEMRKYLDLSSKEKTAKSSASRRGKPLSGKTLAFRLKGLISKKEADLLDLHIAESCEQIDD